MASLCRSLGDRVNLLGTKELTRNFLALHPHCDHFHLVTGSSLQQTLTNLSGHTRFPTLTGL